MAMVTDELVAFLFDTPAHPLRPEMVAWLADSRRFAAFASEFRTKIRKKLRVPHDAESLQDLRLELETAYRLLRERPLSLVYEPQDCGQDRCPDFAVSFTTSLTFMVEVTRLRAAQPAALPGAPALTLEQAALAAPSAGERLVDTLCGKLGQLLPQRGNVLLVGVAETGLTHADLQSALRRVQQRVERNDPAVLRRHRFRDRADFFQHYRRLSEVLVRGLQVDAEPVVVWVNPQAKYPLPSKVRTALYRSHMP